MIPSEEQAADEEELANLRRAHEELCEKLENGDSKAIRLKLFQRMQDPDTAARLRLALEGEDASA